VISYAISLGTKDYILQWNFTFPGTSWTPTIGISVLFNLVPIAVIISLASSWIFLTRQMAVLPSSQPMQKAPASQKKSGGMTVGIRGFFHKIRVGLLKVKGIAYIWNKIHFARATLRSAFIVFLVFIILIFTLSLLTYPRLIYETVSNAYQNNNELREFIQSTGSAASGIGNALAFINNGLVSIAPSFRSFALSVGSILTPLAQLDNAGKYLLFQNAAAWLLAFFAIFYAKYSQRIYRRRKFRRG